MNKNTVIFDLLVKSPSLSENNQMNIVKYKTLISHLPVRQQCFTTKRSTWLKAEREINWLSDLNFKVFDNKDSISISRQDIFNTQGSIRELIIKTIYWGYTGGMRGNHFVNILKNIQKLEVIFSDLVNKFNRTSDDFKDLTKTLKGISGLGLSTYSKILYFLEINFDDNPSLILDQRLIDIFAGEIYFEYSTLKRITYNNGEKMYLEYLEVSNRLSTELQTNGENIEQFLFLFGNNLQSAPCLLHG